MLPYGRHAVSDEDVRAVDEVLRGPWLTTGPHIERFEAGLRTTIGCDHAVAVNSGTAALHCALASLGIGPGDEVIVPALTFVASANAVLYVGATPVFAEVDPRSLMLDALDVERKISPRTRGVIVVHYAGSAVDKGTFERMLDRRVALIEDAAHALGARQKGEPVGARSLCATFSFHPVKHITTTEGGAIVTSSADLAERARRFRNHGLSTDVQTRERSRAWRSEMVDLGFNYRLSDIAAALGTSQLRRLPEGLARRRQIAEYYLDRFGQMSQLEIPDHGDPGDHAWHLFPILIRRGDLRVTRDAFVEALRAENIGATLHYPAVHLQPYYRRRFGTAPGMLPVTEDVCDRILTLPLFPAMTDADVDTVVEAVRSIVSWASR